MKFKFYIFGALLCVALPGLAFAIAWGLTWFLHLWKHPGL